MVRVGLRTKRGAQRCLPFIALAFVGRALPGAWNFDACPCNGFLDSESNNGVGALVGLHHRLAAEALVQTVLEQASLHNPVASIENSVNLKLQECSSLPYIV